MRWSLQSRAKHSPSHLAIRGGLALWHEQIDMDEAMLALATAIFPREMAEIAKRHR